MKHSAATLDDKWRTNSERFYLTGTQALVRLPMLLRQLDIQMWQAKKHLDEHHVHFQPGVNEELAATAIWGSQQLPLTRGAKYDGVFAYWYGKGPGVDRAGDAFRHGNQAGTSRHGGVLVMAG